MICIPFYGLNKLRGCKYLPKFIRNTKLLFQWEVQRPLILFYQNISIGEECQCITFWFFFGTGIHWHYGFHDACEIKWPKFRIRSIRIFGKKIPLNLYFSA